MFSGHHEASSLITTYDKVSFVLRRNASKAGTLLDLADTKGVDVVLRFLTRISDKQEP